MANVKAAMEYAQTFEREAMEKRLSETGSSDFKALTLIDVVVRHEQEIQELKRLITPMSMDENEKREWVNLTDEEINSIEFPESGTATMRDFIRIIEAKFKQKNSSDSAIDKELQRLGCPL